MLLSAPPRRLLFFKQGPPRRKLKLASLKQSCAVEAALSEAGLSKLSKLLSPKLLG